MNYKSLIKNNLWLQLLLALLAIWLVITLIFFFHHRVVARTVEIPGWQLDEAQNLGVQIKKISVYDWQRAPGYYQGMAGLGPLWSLGHRLQGEVAEGYFQAAGAIAAYYSRPYQKTEGYRIEVAGAYLNEGYTQPPRFTVTVNEDLVIEEDSFTLDVEEGGKLSYFTATAHADVDGITHLDVQYHREGQEGPKETAENFEVELYTAFNGPLGYSRRYNPEGTVVEFIKDYQEGSKKAQRYVGQWEKTDKGGARQVLRANEKGQFPWKNLQWMQKEKKPWSIQRPITEYLGELKGIADVFAVTLRYVSLEEKSGAAETMGEQKFYLVEEGNRWKIIDVSPLN
ncbi:hypothetical protein [Desulfofalx alkaliphila]|uniref:hypothetical protein n=1 Tax=Desulfofalx alkaliphila TaxID=105483 RepID=UPI001A9A6A62|nr:hypothetical protein [Desulfofalx alkaliphila]